MDRSEVKAIVDREIEPMMERLGIPHWRIVVNYDLRPREDNDYSPGIGDCTRRIDYTQASIGLDPDGLDDEDHVLEVLRHELFHVLLSPFDLFERAAANATRSDDTATAILARIWTFVTEQGVINLERMYEGLTKHHTAKEPKPMAKASPKKAQPMTATTPKKPAKAEVAPGTKSPKRSRKGKDA